MKRVAIIGASVLLLGALVAGLFWAETTDPRYSIHEFLSFGRYHQYDDLIAEIARRNGMDPEFIKAVIWRESRFRTDMVGSHGERGLMQVTERAAADWAKAAKMETFVPADLFDPRVNIEAGTWYLSHALSHWSGKASPEPFVLAEYNAGRGRVMRWMKDSGQGDTASADNLQAAMDFPGTKNYISAIMNRTAYYRQRGDFKDFSSPEILPPTKPTATP